MINSYMPSQMIYLNDKNYSLLHGEANMSELINSLLSTHFNRYDLMSKEQLAKELKISKAEDAIEVMKNGKD